MSDERDGSPKESDPQGKRRLPEWLACRLDLPPDILPGGMRLEMRGRNLLTVHGTRRILTYSPTCIRLEMKEAVLAVRGKRLCCTAFAAGAVCMDGFIQSLILEEPAGEGTEC